MNDVDAILRHYASTWTTSTEQTAPDLAAALQRTRRRPLQRRRLGAVLVSAAAVLALAVAATFFFANTRGPRPPTGPATASITGTVLPAGGPPPAAGITPALRGLTATVYLFLSDSYDGRPYKTVRTSTTGQFEVEVPAGTFYLAAASPQYTLIGGQTVRPPCRANSPARTGDGQHVHRDIYCSAK